MNSGLFDFEEFFYIINISLKRLAMELFVVIFRRDRNNPKLCRHLLISDIEKIKSSFLLDEVDVRMEQFIDEKFTTGLIILYYNSSREVRDLGSF